MISKNISIFSSGSQTEDELLDEGQIDQENTSTNQNTGEDYGEQENSNSKGSFRKIVLGSCIPNFCLLSIVIEIIALYAD